MAGLGECCSHIAGTLFAVESAVSIANSKSCTDIHQSWHNCLLPKTLQFKRACEIDFGEPATKRRKQFDAPRASATAKSEPTTVVDNTSDDALSFYSTLHEAGGNSVVLSAVRRYAVNFAPKSIQLQLPAPLSNAYKPEHLKFDYYDVMEMSHNILCNMNLSSEQVRGIFK